MTPLQTAIYDYLSDMRDRALARPNGYNAPHASAATIASHIGSTPRAVAGALRGLWAEDAGIVERYWMNDRAPTFAVPGAVKAWMAVRP